MSHSPDELPPPSSRDSQIADVVARCILSLETRGPTGVDEILAAEPSLAAECRRKLSALREAGLLPANAAAAPAEIGGYSIRSLLGRGGMGEVYLGEQSQPVKRRVAIKLIRRGMDSREVLARFAVERHALGLCEHPNIASVYDAGTTDDGRPFIVMQYVDGQPITDFCDDRQLNVQARIKLFCEVCDTVQHAHQRGIVHRDLKPSNILVSDREGYARPSIIDFGVAKSMQQKLIEATLHTQRGQVLGTVEYMSPEQAAQLSDVDTRTDVYSLGCLLHELLVGSLPDEQRTPPSTRFRNLDSARTIARKRRSSDRAMYAALRGDLDWVTLKAIEEDRNRRYQSPAELRADLQRHLAREPVEARPPSFWYLCSRTLARHRTAATAALTTIAALAIGLLLSVRYSFIAQAQADEAAAARRDEAIARIAAERSLSTAVDAAAELLIRTGGERLRRFPSLKKERLDLLETGLQMCHRLLRSGRDSAVRGHYQARLTIQVATFLVELDRPQEALDKLDEAENVLARASVGGAADLDELAHLRCQIELTQLRRNTHHMLGDREQWLAQARHQLALAEELSTRTPGADASRRLREARDGLIAALLDDSTTLAEGEKLLRTDLDDIRSTLASKEASPATRARGIGLIATLAASLSLRGQVEEAIHLLDEVRDATSNLIASDDPDVTLLESLGPVWIQRGVALARLYRSEPAEAATREAIAVYERLTERFPRHSTYQRALATAHHRLAGIAAGMLRYDDAIQASRKAIELQRKVCESLPDAVADKVSLARNLGSLALLLADRFDLKPHDMLDECEELATECLRLVEGLIREGERSARTMDLRANMVYIQGRICNYRGNPAGAVAHLEKAVSLRKDLVEVHATQVGHTIHLADVCRAAARALMTTGETQAALPYAELALEIERDLNESGRGFRDGPTRLNDSRVVAVEAFGSSGQIERAMSLVKASYESPLARFPVTYSSMAESLARAAEKTAGTDREQLLDKARWSIREHLQRLKKMFGQSGRHGAGFLVMQARALSSAARIERLAGKPQQELQQLQDALASWDAILAERDTEAYRTERTAVEAAITDLGRRND